LADSWSTREVVERWHQLFGGTILSERYLREDELLEVEQTQLEGLVATWRERLTSVSWLLTHRAVSTSRSPARPTRRTTALVTSGRDGSSPRPYSTRARCWPASPTWSSTLYAPRSPRRPGTPTTPPSSEGFGPCKPLPSLRLTPRAPSRTSLQPPPIHPSCTSLWPVSARASPRGCPSSSPTPWNWSTGQEGGVRDDKRGAIAENLPPILERVGITRAAWLQLAKDFETHFCSWIGRAEHVERVCQRGGQRWARGVRACRRLFPSRVPSDLSETHEPSPVQKRLWRARA